MPYLGLLQNLVRALPGAAGALLCDSEGEVVVEAGASDRRHRLIGAYQGLALAAVRRTSNRYDSGAIGCIVCRYSDATLILRTLKDGYYFVLSLTPGADIGRWIHLTGGVQTALDKHL